MKALYLLVPLAPLSGGDDRGVVGPDAQLLRGAGAVPLLAGPTPRSGLEEKMPVGRMRRRVKVK